MANGNLFMANGTGNSVTELNTSSGALVRVISASRYQFEGPDAVAAVGGDLFVANGTGNSVTEFPV